MTSNKKLSKIPEVQTFSDYIPTTKAKSIVNPQEFSSIEIKTEAPMYKSKNDGKLHYLPLKLV